VTFLTDFADQAVILPLTVAVAASLLAQRWRRGAAAWLLVVAATLGTTLALKLGFHACSETFGLSSLHTPSGHAAAAAVISGGLAGLLGLRRAAALLAAVGVVALIGLTRLRLGAHSLPEVAVGSLVGLLGAAALLRLAGPPPPGFDARRTVLVAALVLLLFHGLHMPAEAHIRASAAFLSRYFGVCVPQG
jgi:membrane-associated phospholipid phosphatase